MLGNSIYNILANNAEVAALVGTKIFPTIANEGTKAPAMVYKIRSKPKYSKSGHVGDTTIMHVFIIAKTYTQAHEILTALRNALELKTGTFDGVQITKNIIEDIEEEFNVNDNTRVFVVEFSIDHKNVTS